MSLKARVDKLFNSSVGDVSSEIVVKQEAKVLIQKWIGTNRNKVVQIIVRF